MSVRRFNYTRRKRILHEHVSIALSRHASEVSFDADLRLHDYSFSQTSRVIVEAYRQTVVRRFAFGVVTSPRPEGRTLLTGFGDTDAILFRVKVIDTASGLLLGEADRIRPIDPDGGERPSFLSVRAEYLSGEAWRLDFSDDSPVLLIEKAFGPYQSLIGSPHFRWLVLPHIFRALLERALAEDVDDLLDETNSAWQSVVARQGYALTGLDIPVNNDEELIEGWITQAVRAFCRRHSLAQRYGADVFQGVEE